LNNLANEVALSIWYDWHDDGTDLHDQEAHFGIVHHSYDGSRDPVYSPKPSYLAVQTLTRTLQGYRFNKRLALPGPDDYALLFTRNGRVRLAAWTSSQSTHKVTIPASPGRFRVTSCTGERPAAVSADAHGLALVLSDAPQYLEP